jgi:ABC-2 type transport system ATP-binding protein
MLLDEPTTGLDPRSKRDVQEFITAIKAEENVTVLLTTHDMQEAELLCSRLAFLSEGRMVAEGTPAELKSRVADGRDVDAVDMDDVFMAFTGRTLEDDEEAERDEQR